MEPAFEAMKEAKQNTVDGLISWLKKAYILELNKKAEENVKILFKGADAKNIPIEKFQEVIANIAIEQEKDEKDLVKALIESVNAPPVCECFDKTIPEMKTDLICKALGKFEGGPAIKNLEKALEKAEKGEKSEKVNKEKGKKK